MRKKIFVIIASATLLGFVGATGNLHTYVPQEREGHDPNYHFPENHTDDVTGQTPIVDIISLVNKYLRFAIGFVCFLFMIWNGYQLIIARGDGEQMKKATKALTGCAIGLVTCLLAYIIINIAIKIFQ